MDESFGSSYSSREVSGNGGDELERKGDEVEGVGRRFKNKGVWGFLYKGKTGGRKGAKRAQGRWLIPAATLANYALPPTYHDGTCDSGRALRHRKGTRDLAAKAPDERKGAHSLKLTLKATKCGHNGISTAQGRWEKNVRQERKPPCDAMSRCKGAGIAPLCPRSEMDTKFQLS